MKTTIKALLVITTLAFFACNKTDNTAGIDPNATDLSAVQLKSASIAVNDVAVESTAADVNFENDFYADYAEVLIHLAQVKGRTGNLMMGQGYFHYAEGQLPAVSITRSAGNGYPMTLVVDYGAGVKTKKGKVISGKVTIELSAPRNIDGSQRKVTYDKCAIDTIQITGVSTDTFNGDNVKTRKLTSDSNVTFTLANGATIGWVGTNVREWLKGLDTPKVDEDDMIQITGRIDVTQTTGNYARVITKPLIRLGDCQHPVEGTIEFQKEDATNTFVAFATLDYGNGVCDNLATLTTDGKTVDIVLKDQGMPKAKTEGKHQGMGNGGMGNGGMGKGK